jgi:hypothetical protein
MEKKEIKRVLFYTNIPRFFRTTLIGYLYEIAQVYPVVVISEKLDPKTEKILEDKKMFPKIERIIPVHQYTGPKLNLLARHRYFCTLAKNIIDDCRPDIIVVTGNNFFESYLRRFAKKAGATNIFIVRLLSRETKQLKKEYVFRIAYIKMPKFLPQPLKILFSGMRMYLGHILYYWIAPLLIGQRPFLGEPSCALMADNSRHKGIDYFLVFTKQNYKILEKDGVPPEKIYILPHPLARENREVFQEIYFLNQMNLQKDKIRTLTILWRNESIGFRRDNYSFIPEKEAFESGRRVVALAAQLLLGWRIVIKPHPVTTAEEKTEIEKILKPISSQIQVADPAESMEKYVDLSRAVLGLYPSSNSLFEVFLRDPQKPILSIDFNYEFGGDFYREFEGIEYVDSPDRLRDVLEAIREDRYHKEHNFIGGELGLKSKEFSSMIEVLENLMN